jgi:hypothetical protein
MADVAVELITEEGRVITIRENCKSVDPDQPWKISASTPVDVVSIGAFFDNSLSELAIALVQAVGSPEGARSSVDQNATTCWIPARDLASPVTKANVILDGTKTWEISDVKTIGPGTVPVVYICTLGR